MKKTLVALAVTAFAASASAVTVYDNEGTNVQVDGRINVFAKKEAVKVGNTKSVGHSDLANNGSRLGVTIKHNINEEVYGLGRVEFRFDGKDKTALTKDSTGKITGVEQTRSTGSAEWGSLHTKRAFVGIGGYGHQVTFGKQLLIGDEIGLAGFDNYYGVGSKQDRVGGYSILTAEADSAVAYRYTGVKGLTLGANYNFATEHDTGSATKNGYGVGAIYTADVAEGQAVTASLGYTRDNYETGSKVNKHKDAVYGGLKYVVNDLTLAVDGGRAVMTTGNDKSKVSFLRTGVKYAVTPEVAVYGNYGYLVTKLAKNAEKGKGHLFMLGSEYKLHKNVKAYIEGKFNKFTTANKVKVKDKGIGVGLAVFW